MQRSKQSTKRLADHESATPLSFSHAGKNSEWRLQHDHNYGNVVASEMGDLRTGTSSQLISSKHFMAVAIKLR